MYLQRNRPQRLTTAQHDAAEHSTPGAAEHARHRMAPTAQNRTAVRHSRHPHSTFDAQRTCHHNTPNSENLLQRLPTAQQDSAAHTHSTAQNRMAQHKTANRTGLKYNLVYKTDRRAGSTTPPTPALHFRRTTHLPPQCTYTETARNDWPLRSMTQRSTAQHGTKHSKTELQSETPDTRTPLSTHLPPQCTYSETARNAKPPATTAHCAACRSGAQHKTEHAITFFLVTKIYLAISPNRS